MNELEALQRRVAELENLVALFLRQDKYVFDRPIYGGPTGLRLGLTSQDKIGFHDTIPVTQFDTPTGRQDTSGSSGVSMTTGHRFNGNTGSDYYSVGDIVFALKRNGIFKNE